MAEVHGKEQVQIWRRSFDVRPPPMDSNHPNYKDIFENEAFKDIKSQIPNTESLQDLIHRTIPYWQSTIEPCIKNGQKVLIVAHGTSLRGLVKQIENMNNEQVNKLNLPTAIPFVYQLEAESLKPLHGEEFILYLFFEFCVISKYVLIIIYAIIEVEKKRYFIFQDRRYLADEETVKKAVEKVASIGTQK